MTYLKPAGLVVLVVVMVASASAQEQSQWRGPGHHGFVAEKSADGKVLWELRYEAGFKKNQYAVEMAKGPHVTPLVVGNTVITLGVTGREGQHAPFLLTPRHVVFLTNSADLIVAKRGSPAFTVARRYEVAESPTLPCPCCWDRKFWCAT